MVLLEFKVMDILQFRFRLMEDVEKIRPSKEDFDNPVLTKPSPILSVRDIVARYARGEVVFQSEKLYEQPQTDDTIEHVEPVRSKLDYSQRISDARNYLKQLELEYGAETAQKQAESARPDVGVAEGENGSQTSSE